MNIFSAAVAGVVQGLTEFLPVSSSGHLVLLHELTGFSADDMVFDVMLHLATAIAVVGFFRRELRSVFWAWGRHVTRGGPISPDAKLGWLLVAGTVPAALVGALAEDWIAVTFRNVGSVAVMLAVVGILMLLVERHSRPSRGLASVGLSDSLTIGLAQAFALIPGVSRSGITIIAGLQRGLQREAAARFSFLLSVPIVLGASLKKATAVGALPLDDVLPLAVGFIAALLSGWLTIGFLLQYLRRARLTVFAWYRLALAGVLVFVSLFSQYG